MNDTDGPLGHTIVGGGPRRVVVLNDWLCDTSTWDAAEPYLDRERFTWAFTDLRGYGRSRARTGAFTLGEAVADVLRTTAALGWPRFSVVGHSMSAYVAVSLGQHHSDRVERIVLLTPPPPRGFGVDEGSLAAMTAAARDDGKRAEMIRARAAERLSPGWAALKSRRFVDTSAPEAAAAYVALFARDGLATPDAPLRVPALAITGEEDAPPMRRDATKASYAAIGGGHLEVVGLAESGHYPMQEMPPRTVALVERFLGA